MLSMLFITSELPFPAHSGGKLKSLKLLKEFCATYKVDVACPLKGDDVNHVTGLAQTLPDGVSFFNDVVDRPRTGLNLVKSYIQGIPLNVYRTQSTSLAEKIKAIKSGYDIIFVDHYEAFQFVPDEFDGEVVYHAHNAYYAFWQRYAEKGDGFLHRIIAKLETGRVSKEERRVCEKSNLIFAAPNDIDKLVDLNLPREKFSVTYHLGDDSQLDLPALQFSETDKKLVYVGYLGWEPNVHGLLWFIQTVWPLLIEREPDLTFHVVGKNPDARLKSCADATNGIVLRGYVEDLEDEFRSARVCVAPLLFGSGMKVKVLNAMARGLPIVTTSIGAEGIDVVHEQHLMCVDDSDTMAQYILKLLDNEAAWFRLSTESRDLISQKYTWRALFDDMHKKIAYQANEEKSQAA